MIKKIPFFLILFFQSHCLFSFYFPKLHDPLFVDQEEKKLKKKNTLSSVPTQTSSAPEKLKRDNSCWLIGCLATSASYNNTTQKPSPLSSNSSFVAKRTDFFDKSESTSK